MRKSEYGRLREIQAALDSAARQSMPWNRISAFRDAAKQLEVFMTAQAAKREGERS